MRDAMVAVDAHRIELRRRVAGEGELSGGRGGLVGRTARSREISAETRLIGKAGGLEGAA